MKQSMIAEFAKILGTTVEYLVCGVIKDLTMRSFFFSPMFDIFEPEVRIPMERLFT